LARFIREYSIELSPEGRIALDRLADSFDAWKADPAQGGAPLHPEATRPLYQPEKPIGEASDGPPRHDPVTMIERLGPSCAIGTDGRQWIVYAATSAGDTRIAWDGASWKPVGYIHSDKRALLICIEAKGLKLSAQGRAVIERQDAMIWRWRRADELRGIAAE
jgi:hypothetical protein